MPFADRTGPVAPYAIGEVAAKAVDPLTNGFAADDHTALGQKFFDIGRAEDEPMIDPDRICDDLARNRNPFRRGNEDGIFMPVAYPDQNGQTTWHSPRECKKSPATISGYRGWCNGSGGVHIGPQMTTPTCLLYEGRMLQGAHPQLAIACTATVAGFCSAVDTSKIGGAPQTLTTWSRQPRKSGEPKP